MTVNDPPVHRTRKLHGALSLWPLQNAHGSMRRDRQRQDAQQGLIRMQGESWGGAKPTKL